MQSKPRWLRRAVRSWNRKYRKRKDARWPLIEQLERREVLYAALYDLQLVDDTDTPEDLITSDPRVTGTVIGDFEYGWAEVEFDHDADGNAEGLSSISYPDEQFTYDPRDDDPSLASYSGPFPLQIRVIEYDEYGDPMTPSAWQDFTFTINSGGGGGSPEIDVRSPTASSIPDGTGQYDFGQTTVGAAVSKTFTVRNDGTDMLVLDTNSLSLPSGFSLISAFSASVSPGNQTSFTVQLDASTAGSYQGQLSFTNSDIDESPYNFTIQGSVVAGNAAPTAVNDSYSVEQDVTLTIPAAGVLTNDSDPESQTLTASLVSGPAHGTLNYLNSNGAFEYTPQTGFTGSDSFTYVAHDGSLNSNTATVSITVSPPPETFTLFATVRDFHVDDWSPPSGAATLPHHDFEAYSGAAHTEALVLSDLGADGKPVFNPSPPSLPHGTQLTSEALFNAWFHDTPQYNIAAALPLRFEQDLADPELFRLVADQTADGYTTDRFFPIDGQLFNADPNSPEWEAAVVGEGGDHNFHFTMELHATFTYQPDQVFELTEVNDDVWVFINGKLVMDLGGVHPAAQGSIVLDAQKASELGLVAGQTYPLDLFFAQRHTQTSHFALETTFDDLAPAGVLGTISGVKYYDEDGDGARNYGLVVGPEPDVVFVIDVSGSTGSTFQGTPVGNPNNHGGANTILDAEIAGFIELNQNLIDRGFGETADVAIVAYSSSGAIVDMDPATPGLQYTAHPAADADNNGVLDVVQRLKALTHGGGTNFQDGLVKTENVLAVIGGTIENGNVVFLSDGYPNSGQEGSTSQVDAIRALAENVFAFGVGNGASLTHLQTIDPDAEIFTSTDELLTVFSGVNNVTGEIEYTEPGLSGVTIYLDLNNNALLDAGEPTTITLADDPQTPEDETGRYLFTGVLPGTYLVREQVPSGSQQTFPAEGQGHVVLLPPGQTIEDVDFGNKLLDPITLLEETRFLTDDTSVSASEITFIVPANPGAIELNFSNLSFDLDDPSSINDAFELSLVDTAGESVVATIGVGRSAFFNITEGEQPLLGAGVSLVDADTVAVDISQLAPGTELRLIAQLVNNDGVGNGLDDTATEVTIIPAVSFISQLPTSTVATSPPRGAAARPRLAPDFNVLSEVTGSFGATHGVTTFNQHSDLLFADIALTNNGHYSVSAPLLVSVTNISHPLVRLHDPDGFTPDGTPYYDFTALMAEQELTPGQSTAVRALEFYNPERVQFSYELVVLGRLNQAPAFTTDPVIEAVPNKPYSYPSSAVDLDEDTLQYRLLAGPGGMTIDGNTGALAWSPGAGDVGNHAVRIEADDSRGGTDQQDFIIAVSDDIPNRPPVWTSTPVTEAFVNIVYLYLGRAIDADGDVVTYAVDDGPSGLSIDPNTGAVSWSVPDAAQLGMHAVTLRATDEHGAVALQSYGILVLNQPGNHPPIIITDPRTYFEVPDPMAPSGSTTGNVTPQSITLDLQDGESVVQPVSITLPADGFKADVFLLFDDTGSFEPSIPTLVAGFPDVIHALEAALPGVDLAFGVGRFEDYAGAGQPFILNQPIIRTSTSGFWDSMRAALHPSRTAPALGGDNPESLIEALYQVATGAGFDGNDDGDTTDSGPAGPVSTQTQQSSSGDVPAFSTFVPDPANNVLPADGTLGGVGFRSGAIPIILAATDTGTAYEPDFVDPIIGAGGVQVPLSRFQGFPGDFSWRDTTSHNSGAKIQQTISALNQLGALVIGLGGGPPVEGNPLEPYLEYAMIPDHDARQVLEAIAELTGAINMSATTFESIPPHDNPYTEGVTEQLPADPVEPGDPLYFLLEVAEGAPSDDHHELVTQFLNGSHPLDLYLMDGDGSSPVRASIVEILEPPSHGTVTISPDGDYVTYTPLTESWSDGFTYRVSTGSFAGNDLIETVHLGYDPWNTDPPTPYSDEVHLHHQAPSQPLDIYVLNNDPTTGSRLKVKAVTQPNNGSGSVTISNDGDYVTFTPSGAFVDDWFGYTVEDAYGNQATASVTLRTDQFVEYDPGYLLQDDYFLFHLTEPHPIPLYVLNNDSDAEGDVLRITSVTQPAAGSVAIGALGDYLVYTPPPEGFPISVEFSYTVDDASLGSGIVKLFNSMATGLAAQPATASDDSWSLFNIRPGHPLNLHVLENDWEPNGDLVQIAAVSQSTSGLGEVTIAPSGDYVTYTPPSSGLIADTFTYTIIDAEGVPSTATVTLHSPSDPHLEPAGIAAGISSALTAALTSVLFDIDLIASDPTVDFTNLTGVIPDVASGATLNFDAQFTADGLGHAFELLFVREGSGLAFGSIPVLMNPSGYLYDVDAIDPDDDPITYELTHGPVGATFNAATQRIEWMPPGQGSYDFTLVASDGRGGVDTQSFQVQVTTGDPNEPPNITTLIAPAQTEPSRAYAFDVDAVDPDEDVLSYFLTAGPAGMDIDRKSGRVSWTPAKSDLNPDSTARDHSFTVRVIDGRGGSSEQTYTVTVNPSLPNTSPTITTQAPTGGQQKQLYSYAAAATDAESDPLAWDLVVHPVGMTVEPQTGRVLWEPTARDVGLHEIILRVQDGQGGVDLEHWELTVAEENLPPEIISTPPGGPAVVARELAYHVRAVDPNGDDITYSIDAASHSNGVAVDAHSGLLTWKPLAAHQGATHAIQITASDGDKSATQTMSLSVAASGTNDPPQILSTPRTRTRADRQWIYLVEAVDPNGDRLTYALDGTPPTGLTITEHALVWTPDGGQLGSHNVTVRVTDSGGAFTTQPFALDVIGLNTNAAPSITSNPPLNATLDRAYRYDLAAEDPDGDPIEYQLVSGPDGLTLHAELGAIRWTPTVEQLGPQEVVVRAVDPYGGADAQTFTVATRAMNLPPAITSIPVTTGKVNVEYLYAVSASDPEGDPIAWSVAAVDASNDPVPAVAIDGAGLIRWTPQTGEDGTYTLTVTAADSLGGEATQVWTLVVADGAMVVDVPPVITSLPPRIASLGETFSYDVESHDPDGPGATYLLTETPPLLSEQGEVAMTINATSGLITWSPPPSQVGSTQFVTVKATSGGLAAWQRFSLLVRPVNQEPVITSTPPTPLDAGREYRYDVQVDNPDHDPLEYSLQAAPAGMTIDRFGRIRWQTTTADAGTYNFDVTATDHRGAADPPQQVTLVVVADTQPPQGALVYAPDPGRVNREVTLLVSAIDNVQVASITLTVDGQLVPLDDRGFGRVTKSAAGTYPAVATITDGSGNSVTLNEDVLIVGAGAGAPQVSIASPADRDVITAPTLVTGTVADADLNWYKLDVLSLDGRLLRTIADVNGGGGTITPINGGTLGTFDPTTLDNGSYILRLTADDLDPTNGGATTTEIVINISGNLKLGNFTMSFTDLTIPVAGIPITIGRTYDTLRAHESGDFGYGWRLDLEDFDVAVDFPPGPLSQFGGFTTFRDGTRITITRENGSTEGFTFTPWKEVRSLGLVTVWHPHFVPDEGVRGVLVVKDFALTQVFGDEYISWGAAGAGYNPANPVFGGTFSYYSIDGSKRTLDARTGDVISITDRNDNTITFEPDAIVSNRGRKVLLERDHRGRITKITDPRGNSLRYGYDGDGNLVSMTDRTGNATFQYTYRADHEHYLETIVDPYGRTVSTADYDADGRLESIRDAHGNQSLASYDLANLSESMTDPHNNTRTAFYDPRGNEIESIDFDGTSTRRAFDASDRLTSDTLVVGLPDDPSNGETNDVTASYEYNAAGEMSKSVDPLGHVTRFTANEAGQPETITDALGNTARYLYGEMDYYEDGQAKGGDLMAIVDPGNNVKYFQRDAYGNMKSYTVDVPFNNFSWYDMMNDQYYEDNYDPNCDPAVDPACQPLTRPEYPTASFEHDALGDLMSSNSPAGVDSTITRDANGNRLSSSLTWVNPDDANDIRTVDYTHTFDANDQLTQTVGPDGTTGVQYDLLGRPVENTNSTGASQTVLDALGNTIELTHANGFVQRMVYDASGRTIWETDARPSNQPVNGTRTDYDAVGRVTKQERYANVAIDLVPQGDGSLRAEFASSDAVPLWTIESTYNSDGTLASTMSKDGLWTTFEYDKAGQQLASQQIIGGATLRWEKEYDPAGNVTLQRDPLGRETRHVFDGRGREVTTVFANGAEIELAYTPRGALAARTDELGRTTDYTYDASGNLTSVTLPEVYDPVSALNVRPSWTYEYDDHNNLQLIRDPLLRERRFDFDEEGRQTAWTRPDVPGEPTVTESRTYDALGRLETVTDFAGQIMVNHYDTLGRIDLVEYFSSASDQTAGNVADSIGYEYDIFDGNGWRHDIVTDARGVSDMAYDVEGNLVSIAGPEGTVNYEYSSTGRLIRVFTTNSDIHYDYDIRGLLAEVRADKQLGVTLSVPEITTYTYDSVGNLIASTLPNGVVTSIDHDVMNRPEYVAHTSSGGALLDSYYYLRDAAGKITTVFNDYSRNVVESAIAAGTADTLDRVEYSYDGLDRILEEMYFDEGASSPFHKVDYQWDLVSNLLNKTVQTGGDTEAYTYTHNARDQIVDEVFRLNGQEQWTASYDYDDNGALISRTRPGKSESFTYNVRGRLQAASIQETIGGQTTQTDTSYVYDHTGIRTEKSVTTTDASGSSTDTTLYLNDPKSPYGYNRVLEELTPGGIIKASFVHGALPISQSLPTATSFYLSDAHSGIRLLGDPTETITDTYLYDSFGNLITSTGASPNPLQYRSERFDSELGQYYLRARYYEPEKARFGSRDPFAGIYSTPITLHKHLYAGGDPLQFVDPTGESMLSATMVSTGLQISGHAVKTKADVDQGNRVIGARLGHIAMWMMQFNLYVVEAEERSLLSWMWFVDPYNRQLSVAALGNAGAYFNNSKKRTNRFLEFATKYGAPQLAGYTGVVSLKSNGLLNYSGNPLHHVPGSVTAFVLTGDHFLDTSAAKALTGMAFVPGWFAEWHHHEVVGIMMLVPTALHRGVPHIGGKEFWEVSNGREYVNSWPQGTPPA